jgi:hypothetical protein
MTYKKAKTLMIGDRVNYYTTRKPNWYQKKFYSKIPILKIMEIKRPNPSKYTLRDLPVGIYEYGAGIYFRIVLTGHGEEWVHHEMLS